MLKRALLASVGVFVLSVGANAADLYRAPEGGSLKDTPVYSPVWTGFYAGVNGGYAWGG